MIDTQPFLMIIMMSMDKGITEEINEKELGLISDIIRTITKTAKTFNVYPKDNPIYQKFAGELFDKFSAFFESNDTLALDIEPHSLLYKENKVFHSEERTDNIALLLFADGLRQISFNKGITLDEITDFIDILRFVPKSETTDEDDIVTLLWEKNIRNMGYTAVEDTVDDDLAVEEGLLLEDMERETARASTIETSAEGAIQISTAGSVLKPSSEEAIQSINNKLQSVDENFLLSAAVELFLDMLSYEHDTESFHLYVQNLGKIMDIRMQKKDMKGAMEILLGLEKISSAYNAPQQQEMISAIKARAGSPENLGILFRELPDADKIRQYLSLLGRPLIPNMIQTLGELQDRRQRRLLCETLAELGREDVDIFADALSDKQWYLLRNLAMILGMTKQPGAVRHIEKILKHSDVRVRREAVRALDGIHTDETKNLFFSLLKDDDHTVRMTALKSLSRFRDPALFKAMKETVSVEKLKEKPFAEKRTILETLASLGGKDALPMLAELLKKRGFIEKEDITEIRAAAAYGLGIVGTPEASALLEKEAGSKKDILREACLKALKKT